MNKRKTKEQTLFEQAMVEQDVLLMGVGYLKITPEGIERLDPQQLIKEGQEAKKHLESLRYK